MDKPIEASNPSMPLAHWLVLLCAIAVVVVPWWLGLMWIVGVIA